MAWAATLSTANRFISDGTYTYSYDAEGNRTERFIDADTDGVLVAGDTDVTQYAWDNRNRLTEVKSFDDYTDYSADTPTKVVDYIYDVENRLIGEKIDADGDGVIDHQTRFAYDIDWGLSQFSSDENGTVPLTANQIVLQFDKDGTGDVTVSDLSHRYLWGQAVDQLLADEQLLEDEGGYDLETPGAVVWPLIDHLGTVRDLAIYDAQSGVTSVVNHRVYDAYGNLKSELNPATGQAAAVDCLFAFTGRPLDKATGLQNNLNRWYDPKIGSWISQDPIGFKSGTTNLHVYCWNNPVNFVDPTGLIIWPVLDDLVIISNKTHVPRGIDHCDRWADAFMKAVPKSSWYKLEKVVWTYPQPGLDQIRDFVGGWFGVRSGDIRLRHVGVRVTFSDGSVVYFDDGWWGGWGLTSLFYPSQIPWYVREGP